MPISTSRPRTGSSRRLDRPSRADQFQFGATRFALAPYARAVSHCTEADTAPGFLHCRIFGRKTKFHPRLCGGGHCPENALTHGSSRMIGRMFTVGGLTLLSRLTGFARDILLAAVLGAGPVADAFFVALRLPNHFRAIFAEGAFNAAFIPAYAHVHGERGEASARLFSDRIFTLLFASQLVLLVVAWLFMPQAMSILAPGFTEDAEQRRLAIELTRITFPYLLLITLVTLYGGMLNVMHRFASAAA